MKYLILVLFILLLGSCKLTKDQRRVQRASNKIEKLDREARTIAFEHRLSRIDTIEAEVTYIAPAVQIDTFIQVTRDTIEIVRENLKIKMVQHDSLIFLDAKCDTITVIETVQITKELIGPTKFIEVPISKFKKIMMWLGGFLSVLFSIVIVKKIIDLFSF